MQRYPSRAVIVAVLGGVGVAAGVVVRRRVAARAATPLPDPRRSASLQRLLRRMRKWRSP